ncbi:MAG: hypothetical protein AB7I34_25385 [Rhizobiaceae bacterium]
MVAPVTIRPISPSNINGVSGHFPKARVIASGWHVQDSELVFTAIPDTAPFSIEERRHFGRGHLHVGELRADLTADSRSDKHTYTTKHGTTPLISSAATWSSRSAVPA